MTDEQIIEKVVEKAVKNGWDAFPYTDILDKYVGDGLDDEYYIIIFSNSLAKAFWGEEKCCFVCATSIKDKLEIKNCKMAHDEESNTRWEWDLTWKHHLRRMVIEKDPLQYLKKFL